MVTTVVGPGDGFGGNGDGYGIGYGSGYGDASGNGGVSGGGVAAVSPPQQHYGDLNGGIGESPNSGAENGGSGDESWP